MASEVTHPSPIDWIEARILAAGGELRPRGGNSTVAPVTHRFTPGLYTREMRVRAGVAITSEVHRTEHPFVVSQGACLVYRENGQRERIEAPYTGITKPGTRRLILVLEDLVWTTFHPTEHTTVEAVEAAIYAPRQNPLLEYGESLPRLRKELA